MLRFPMDQTHTGTGYLITDGTEHLCQYHLELRNNGLKSGAGFVVSTPDALWSAFNATRALIRMSDGRSFPMIVTSFSPGNEDAPFQMAGDFLDT
ncbi:MAG: hypothetical protein JWR84_3830 [Caulobacter sp.]|nr:hypothetical protein [Caulobacter sp.]